MIFKKLISKNDFDKFSKVNFKKGIFKSENHKETSRKGIL